MRKIVVVALTIVLALGLVGIVKVWPSSTASAATVTRYQQTDSRIAYVGTWHTFSTSGASGGSYLRTSSNSASATVTFNGTYLAWIATKGTTLGKAYVSLDGRPAVSVELSRYAVAYRQKVWETGTLTYGKHTVKIWRNPSSLTGKYVSVDAFDVAGSLVTAGSTTTTTNQPTTTTTAPNTTTTTPVAAISNLQSAINAAASGSTLTVPAGTYGAIQINKPLTLVGQAGAVINAGTNTAVSIGSSNVTIRGFTIKGFNWAGIFANGTYSGITIRDVYVDGGNRAVFGIHMIRPSGVTIANTKAYYFTSSSAFNYPAHAIYLDRVSNLVITGTDVGYTAGMGTHSGVDLDDVVGATLDGV